MGKKTDELRPGCEHRACGRSRRHASRWSARSRTAPRPRPGSWLPALIRSATRCSVAVSSVPDRVAATLGSSCSIWATSGRWPHSVATRSACWSAARDSLLALRRRSIRPSISRLRASSTRKRGGAVRRDRGAGRRGGCIEITLPSQQQRIDPVASPSSAGRPSLLPTSRSQAAICLASSSRPTVT